MNLCMCPRQVICSSILVRFRILRGFCCLIYGAWLELYFCDVQNLIVSCKICCCRFYGCEHFLPLFVLELPHMGALLLPCPRLCLGVRSVFSNCAVKCCVHSMFFEPFSPNIVLLFEKGLLLATL